MATDTIQIPARLNLDQIQRLIASGNVNKVFDTLMQLQEKAGIEIDKALTPQAVFAFLKQFQVWAPMGEWRPPAGVTVEHINVILVVEAGTTFVFDNILHGSAIDGSVKKWREISLTPMNRTAEDDVQQAQKLFTPRTNAGVAMLPDFSSIACHNQGFGDFSTIENINIPFKGWCQLWMRNTNANSDARLQVEAIAWETDAPTLV